MTMEVSQACPLLIASAMQVRAQHFTFAGDDCGFSMKMQRAMLSALGKTPKEFVHVDMQQKMIEKGLLNLIPAEAWPPTNAVGHCTLCSLGALCQ